MEIQKNELGIIIISPVIKEQEEQFAIAFANDIDFTTNEEDYKKKFK